MASLRRPRSWWGRAAAYLLPEAPLTQRVVHAKRKIREAGMPLSIPANLDERVDALLRVLYLIFNEGYLSRGAAHVTRVGNGARARSRARAWWSRAQAFCLFRSCAGREV